MKRPTILFCEDEADQRELLGDMLRSEGYQLLLAKNGVEALAIAEASLPDLILADFMMPGIDGAELGRRLKENPRTAKIPFILSSAVAGFEQAGGPAFQPDALLNKPWSWPDLFALLARWLPPAPK